MYFKLAIKNVKKSYKDYLIYFLTLMFSVAIFYTFNSFDNQAIILDLNNVQNGLIEMLKQIMSILSFVVAGVCGFLILYANSFLIKRRKKELGLYTLLGMKERSISRILVYETLIIGLLSLISGLIIGYILSQGITLLTAKILVVSVNYRFVFSVSATISTIISFFVIFLVVMLFNTRIIRKYKLIDLLKSDRTNQELKLKNPKLSIVLFLVALVFLGVTYWAGLTIGVSAMLPIVITGSIGTFLFFYSLSGFLLSFVQSRKKAYYKGLNMFVLRQINAKINSTFASISVICLMLLVAIGAVATGFNLNNFVGGQLNSINNFDTTVAYNVLKGDDSKLSDYISYDLSKVEKEYYYTTYSSDLDLSMLANFSVNEDAKNTLAGAGEAEMKVIPVSEYNQIMSMYEGKYIDLKPKEGIIYFRNDNFSKTMKQLNKASLDVYGNDVSIKEVIETDDLMSLFNTYGFFVVVNDNEIPDDVEGNRIWSMKLKDSSSNLQFVEDMEPLFEQYRNEHPERPLFASDVYDAFNVNPTTMESRTNIESGISGLTMMITYIGLYLGVIFLMSSVVILALQQLSEANDNQKRYEVLSKLGVSKKMINRSILKQISLYFFIPLALAGIHAVVGVTVVLDAFTASLGMDNMFVPTLLSVGVILSIYFLYFYITYSSSKGIIYGEKR